MLERLDINRSLKKNSYGEQRERKKEREKKQSSPFQRERENKGLENCTLQTAFSLKEQLVLFF